MSRSKEQMISLTKDLFINREGESMRGRKPSENSKYFLPVRQYCYAVEYALMRDTWAAEVQSLRNQSKAITYDKDRVQSSNDYNATEEAAMKILPIQEKIDRIDETLREVSEGMEDYIKLAVCNGFTYTQLTTGRYHMPLNSNAFGEIKHKFYFYLYTKI